MCYEHCCCEHFENASLTVSLKAFGSAEDAIDLTHMASAFLRGLRQIPITVVFHAITQRSCPKE